MTLDFDNSTRCPTSAALPDLLVCQVAHHLARCASRPRTQRRGSRCVFDLSLNLAGLH
jgi:hypothetical protein